MSEQPDHSNDRLDNASDDVENASMDSFPASDPPKWSSLRLGPPIHQDAVPTAAEERKTSDEPPSDGKERRNDQFL